MSEQRMTTDDLAFLKHEAAFWEDRYKTQHRTVHALESELSLSLAREQRLVDALKSATDALFEATEWLEESDGWKLIDAAARQAHEALSSVPDGEGQ